LEDPESNSTKLWIEAENLITSEYLDTVPDVERLRVMLIENQYFNKISLPEKQGQNFCFFHNADMYMFNEKNWYKFNEEDPLQGTTLFMNSSSTPAKGETYDWESSAFTSDGKYVAYMATKAGSDWKTIRVKNIETMQDLQHDIIKQVKFSLIFWDNENNGFYYSRYDENLDDGTKTTKVGANRVYYHKLNTKQADDIMIYENPNEPDGSFSTYITLDNKYLIITTKKSTEETALKHYIELDKLKDRDLS
jgi:prolyl oligopeptidase